MSFKWIFVLLIVLWFAYEALAPYIHDLWARYRMHMKFALCVTLCAIVLSLPSLESFLTRHRELANYLCRNVLHEDTLGSSARVAPHARVLEGTRMADAHAAHPVHPTTHPARILSDVEKRVVAARQQWKCYRCRDSLRADYRVWVSGQAQPGSNGARTAAAMCPRCFANVVLASRGVAA